MDDIESLEDKSFAGDDYNSANIKYQNLKEVATVTLCLCEEHHKCTGVYIDYTKTYLVKCSCSCHDYGSDLKGDK